MTIAVDCRMIKASGIGVYLRGCLPFLLQSGNDFLLLGNAGQLHPFASKENVKIIICNIKPFSIKELLFFPKKITKHINKSNIFFSPFFNIPRGIKIPVFTSIHDIIFPDMPKLFSRVGLAARMWFFRRAFTRSKKIFTVSEFSKSRIEHYSCQKVPVVVTHISIQPELLQWKIKKITKENTIIFIGNIKKYKGLDTLLEAFLLARKEGLPHKLVIIGDRDNFRTVDNSFLRKIDSINSGAVFFDSFVSNEKLVEYLSLASLLVQPSLYEGFGLPPLEAMFLGTNVLISDIPVFKEIYGDFPVTFFRAGDSNDLKEKLLKLLLNKKPSPPVLSDKLLSKYTFEKTASIILRELQ